MLRCGKTGMVKKQKDYRPEMEKDTEIIRHFRWSDLSQEEGWEAWRNAKIRISERVADLAPVAFDNLANPSPDAVAELERRCLLTNHALYHAASEPPTVEAASDALVSFARHFGLLVKEDHRSASELGVVALRTSSEESQKGYLPYTPRPLNWHTDGYYNAPDRPVMGFVLHCFRQALAGGENQLLDPEIAYMRLREENPAFVRALMHPRAMTIPENREPDGSVRPASVGPVFYPDPATGRLQMRYTARTRSIEWRDEAVTRAAAEYLRELLMAGDPLMRQVRLAPGQGILNNNVLHNRTGFRDGGTEGETRIILRVRFHVRVAEDCLHGAA